ncbi:MAG: response regulator [Scytolyngbya sp. HA4215-MV1]|nr:response regulator [Scytolyngbya sp. HA4215-MV1]
MATQKILVIDDSLAVRKQVQELLPKGNFEVLEAKNGQEGLTIMLQESPNLIMMDFLMPRMSGWELFQKMQTEPKLQRIPLVVMSGRKEEVAEKIPEPFERFAFIEKPFDQKQLVDAIKQAMRIAQSMPPAPVVVHAAPVGGDAGTGASSAEIQALNAKVAKLQAEVDALKKQTAQILAFIKQKLR